MSYSVPQGDAANFSWFGVEPYSPPAGDAANFSWFVDPITGWSSPILKLWNGSTWVTVSTLKRWSGTTWEPSQLQVKI